MNYGAKHNLRFGAVLATLSLLLVTPVADAEWLGDARPLMGTEVSVWFWSDDAEADGALIEAVFNEAARIDRLMSTYKDESKISEINRHAADHPVVAGNEIFELIKKSIEVSRLTDGAFDITYESVGKYYDFRERLRPTSATVASELDKVNFRFIKLDEEQGTVEFSVDGVRINLGGIAKGYVVERGAEILRKHGISSGVVTAGGDSRLLGNRRGQPFVVGIRDPREEGKVAMRIPLEDEAYSTSGDYERFFDEDGVRYHHILTPSTGEPAKGVHSATVIGPDAVMTDALSTSVFVMGVHKGLGMIATLPEYESIVIDAQGRLYFSDGLMPPANP